MASRGSAECVCLSPDTFVYRNVRLPLQYIQFIYNLCDASDPPDTALIRPYDVVALSRPQRRGGFGWSAGYLGSFVESCQDDVSALKYIPSWFPGAGFKPAMEFFVVGGTALPSLSSRPLSMSDLTEELLTGQHKWTALTMYRARAGLGCRYWSIANIRRPKFVSTIRRNFVYCADILRLMCPIPRHVRHLENEVEVKAEVGGIRHPSNTHSSLDERGRRLGRGLASAWDTKSLDLTARQLSQIEVDRLTWSHSWQARISMTYPSYCFRRAQFPGQIELVTQLEAFRGTSGASEHCLKAQTSPVWQNP
ncbi:hypothetical protein HD554DRAFT_2035224 [Boletus coccyginus]|nr:hypothetical protein HD554DRAFT_2035224 [Boletus coccyginus]